MPSESEDTDILSTLLTKCRLDSTSSFDLEEIQRLLRTFSPDFPRNDRVQAYLCLSAICDRTRKAAASTEDGTSVITGLFLPQIESGLAELEENLTMECLSFLSALFSVDWQSATRIFQHAGIQDSMMDAIDLFSTSLPLQRIIAELISQACGIKACRDSLISSCTTWLSAAFRDSKDPDILGHVALSYAKLLQSGPSQDSADKTDSGEHHEEDKNKIFQVIKQLIMALAQTEELSKVQAAIEGLVYLSSDPTIKEVVVSDTALLRCLMALGQQSSRARTNQSSSVPSALLYGLSTIISNLTLFRRRLSEEESQIEKLKRMAQPRSSGSGVVHSTDDLDSDNRVRARVQKLLSGGAVDVLVAIVRVAGESKALRSSVSRALFSFVEDKENRGKVLQAGGARALSGIIKASLSKDGMSQIQPLSHLEATDLLAIQALAKLCITSSPLQVFGPNEGLIHDSIRPFVSMLLYEASTSLQRFEALMALTNLATASQETASRIAKASRLLPQVELYLLHDNYMIRRAAAELTCNLIQAADDAFNRFSGEGPDTPRGNAKSRLQILIALSDVEDTPTRLAASGSLAILTESSLVCDNLVSLQVEHHRVLKVFKALMYLDTDDQASDLNPGLTHRGAVCIRNLVLKARDFITPSAEMKKELEDSGIVPCLVEIIKQSTQRHELGPALPSVAEALKGLSNIGYI